MEPWEIPARLLPVPFPPIHGEVLGWYLNRLARANCTSAARIAESLAPTSGHLLVSNRTDALSNWAPSALPRLAAMTGASVETLKRSLPGLARLAARDEGEIIRLRRDLCVACPHCMRRKGITRPVLAHLPVGLQLCTKHGIWLNGNTHYRLDQLPEVINAQHHHRRLAKRFPHTLGRATDETRKIVHSWLMVKNQPRLRSRWQRRIQTLPQQEPRYSNLIRRRRDDRELIVTYPEFVALLGMLANPRWRRLRMRDSMLVPAEEHRQTMAALFTEAEHRLTLPTLREMPDRKKIFHDPLSRWADPRGRAWAKH
ncbi:TniQ family protein [Streptomyces shenzhenensis]|uniref:TniQ family protein n=1 Tax=Streptomyces shenzhenensis TaxID=943815 RepID=UPI00381F2988